jgi:hypothetical protein
VVIRGFAENRLETDRKATSGHFKLKARRVWSSDISAISPACSGASKAHVPGFQKISRTTIRTRTIRGTSNEAGKHSRIMVPCAVVVVRAPIYHKVRCSKYHGRFHSISDEALY